MAKEEHIYYTAYQPWTTTMIFLSNILRMSFVAACKVKSEEKQCISLKKQNFYYS